jgi:hypothetical protein
MSKHLHAVPWGKSQALRLATALYAEFRQLQGIKEAL